MRIYKKNSIFAHGFERGMIILITISVLLLLLSGIFSRRRWYAPTNLMLGVWLVSLVSYAYFDQGLHPLKSNIVWALALWLIVFCAGAWLIQSLYIKPIFDKVESSVPVRDILYYFTLGSIPVMILWVIWIVARGDANVFSALRDANVTGVYGVRTASFFVLIWMVSYIVELLVISRHNIWRVLVLFLANLFYAVVSMGKMNFMILFLATAIIMSSRGLLKFKHLLVAFACLLTSFVAIQMVRGSYTNPRHFTALYLTSSLANLDQNVQPSSSEQVGENTGRFFYALRSALDGGRTEVVNPILDFQWAYVGNLKYYSNTYTALYPFYKDFGWMGVVGFAWILGVIFGYLFKSAEDGSHLALVMYAILAGTIVMQFIGDTFFTILSQNIQYFIVALIPFVISKYHLFEPSNVTNG